MTGQTTYASAHMSRGELAADLEARICSGELLAGTRLPSERQLAERYGVSRPIVREALRTLVERGLVEVLPARGSFVRGARPTDAAGVLDAHYRRSQATPRDLVEARTMLECTAAALAAERATADDLEQIDAALARFDRAGSVVERARYDLVFHLAVARAAHNPVIETMFGSITGLTVDLMLRSLSDRAVTDASVPYHAEIRDAIGARDPERARYDLVFHLAVARAAHNPVIETMFGSITGLTVELMLRSLSDRAVTDASVPYHTEIRDAIGARNPQRARQAMMQHLTVATRFYGEDYETSLESLAQRHLARLLEPGSTLDRLLEEAAPAAGGRRYG